MSPQKARWKVSKTTDILNGQRYRIEQADCLDWLRALPDSCVDLVCCSPPYEAARTYGIDFNLRGQEWVDWCLPRFLECIRVSRGLVVWVVQGRTKKFRWTATPALLMADLHRAGVHLRHPAIFHRVGIPGSGGPDFWRTDTEFCVCGSRGGKLPWSDNTATGKPCRHPVGGAMSYRNVDGIRKNARIGCRVKLQTRRKRSGARERDGLYVAPMIANPGNVIRGTVGKGQMGSDLCHENEAPYPEWLVEPYVRCFAPPNGIVCDIFSGSGTTAAVALKWNRRFIGCDIRESQVELTKRRVAEIQPMLIA